MTEPNLDGILIDLAVANIDGSYGYDEEAHDKATKAIKALIANQVREARIDECEQLMALKWSVDERYRELKGDK